MKRGIYEGDIPLLFGETAILRQHESGDPDKVMAQFDNLKLPKLYTHGWNCFPARFFAVQS